MRSLIALAVVGLFAIGVWLAFSMGDKADSPTGASPRAEPPADAPVRDPLEVASPRSVRVLVLEPDLITPAPGRVLQVYSFVPRRMEPPRYVRTVRSGSDGIAPCGELPDGSYIVCGPGASPRAPEPQTARTPWEHAGADRLVRVVDRSTDVAIRLVANATFTPRYGVSPKLVLRRKDDGTGAPIEQPDVLKPGSMSIELAVAVGRYHVEVEPIGELTVHPDNRTLTVSAARSAADFVVAVADNPARVDVRLTGLPEAELPARVYPQPADVVLDDRPERSWWGPHRWHRVDLQVPAIEGPRRVLVYGQKGVYRSRSVVDLSGDRAEVVLEPAVRVIVDQFDWDPRRDVGAVLSAEVGDEVVARAVAPRFGAEYPGLEQPALGGELVVARGGAIRLELQRADGSTAWRREVTPDAETVRVRIE